MSEPQPAPPSGILKSLATELEQIVLGRGPFLDEHELTHFRTRAADVLSEHGQLEGARELASVSTAVTRGQNAEAAREAMLSTLNNLQVERNPRPARDKEQEVTEPEEVKKLRTWLRYARRRPLQSLFTAAVGIAMFLAIKYPWFGNSGAQAQTPSASTVQPQAPPSPGASEEQEKVSAGSMEPTTDAEAVSEAHSAESDSNVHEPRSDDSLDLTVEQTDETASSSTRGEPVAAKEPVPAPPPPEPKWDVLADGAVRSQGLIWHVDSPEIDYYVAEVRLQKANEALGKAQNRWRFPDTDELHKLYELGRAGALVVEAGPWWTEHRSGFRATTVVFSKDGMRRRSLNLEKLARVRFVRDEAHGD